MLISVTEYREGRHFEWTIITTVPVHQRKNSRATENFENPFRGVIIDEKQPSKTSFVKLVNNDQTGPQSSVCIKNDHGLDGETFFTFLCTTQERIFFIQSLRSIILNLFQTNF